VLVQIGGCHSVLVGECRWVRVCADAGYPYPYPYPSLPLVAITFIRTIQNIPHRQNTITTTTHYNHYRALKCLDSIPTQAIMAALLRTPPRPDLYVCARCTFHASKPVHKTTRRWLLLKDVTKAADAEMKWQEQAREIKSGRKKSMLTLLEERGLVQTITG
jgi:hypothetical protein